MIRIALVCAGGISTSFLEQNIIKVMQKRSIQGIVSAYSETHLQTAINQFDVVLLAPQARFAESRIRKICVEHHKAFGLIDPTVYGRMDGEAVLDLALQLADQKGGTES